MNPGIPQSNFQVAARPLSGGGDKLRSGRSGQAGPGRGRPDASVEHRLDPVPFPSAVDVLFPMMKVGYRRMR